MTVTEPICSKLVLALNVLYTLYRASWKSLEVKDVRTDDVIFTSSVTFLLLKERPIAMVLVLRNVTPWSLRPTMLQRQLELEAPCAKLDFNWHSDWYINYNTRLESSFLWVKWRAFRLSRISIQQAKWKEKKSGAGERPCSSHTVPIHSGATPNEGFFVAACVWHRPTDVLYVWNYIWRFVLQGCSLNKMHSQLTQWLLMLFL